MTSEQDDDLIISQLLTQTMQSNNAQENQEMLNSWGINQSEQSSSTTSHDNNAKTNKALSPLSLMQKMDVLADTAGSGVATEAPTGSNLIKNEDLLSPLSLMRQITLFGNNLAPEPAANSAGNDGVTAGELLSPLAQ